MRYLGMGIAFASIGFVVVSIVISLLTAMVWRVFRTRLRRPGPLLLMRLMPSVGAVTVVLGLVVPAFLHFEPRQTSETPGPALLVFILLAGGLTASGCRRAVTSWLDTRRLERTWRSVAVPAFLPGLPFQAYRVPSEMPFAALVGHVRPRLYVSDRFFDALSADERRAVLQHEVGHELTSDNLKRLLIRLAPDWLSSTVVGRELEDAWGIAVEEAADDHAAGPDGVYSLELASALLKASRFTPTRCAPVSHFCDQATITRRVARLLEDPPAPRRVTRRFAFAYAWIPLVLAAAALLLVVGLPATYGATESFIRLLQ